MTPLEQARQQQKKGCDTCAKRVVLRPHGASYCKVSGKLLLSSLLDVGQCAHVPSEYEPKGDDMKTRENELHEPKISEKYFYVTMLNCQKCGEFLAKDERVSDIPIDIRIKECKRKIPNYCPNCGARLKEVGE